MNRHALPALALTVLTVLTTALVLVQQTEGQAGNLRLHLDRLKRLADVAKREVKVHVYDVPEALRDQLDIHRLHAGRE